LAAEICRRPVYFLNKSYELKMSMKFCAALAVVACSLAMIGCGVDAGKPRDEPVKFSGSLSNAAGKPVSDVMVLFVPQFVGGAQTSARVGPDGKFTISLNPGKFVYFFEPAGGKEAAFRAIPQKYQSVDKDTIIDVVAGQDIAIRLN
jgi:hypothetical protein